jgi:hypothetical protein
MWAVRLVSQNSYITVMKQSSYPSRSYLHIASALRVFLEDIKDIHDIDSSQDDSAFLTDSHIIRLFYEGVLGVWDSSSHGAILWIRLTKRVPVYRYLGRLLGSGMVENIAMYEHRAVFLDLNNALLQEEGFE